MTKRNHGREAAVKRLRAYAKPSFVEAGDDDFEGTIARETDRGVVIIFATAVEDMLGWAIGEKFVHLSSEEKDRLFGPDAPIGSFSARIKLAHALGILDRDLCRMCDLLREMRNACAHTGRDITFAKSALSDVLDVLWKYISDEAINPDIPPMRKVVFGWVVSYIMRAVRTGSRKEASKLIQKLVDEFGQSIRDKASAQSSPETQT